MAEIVPYINEQQEIMKNAHYIRQFGYYWPFYLPDEVFVRISSFEPDILDRYWISNYGKVYDENIGGLMKPIIQSTGYWAISLQRKKEYYTNHNQHSKIFNIHYLVCTAFNGPKPTPKHVVNHINNIRCANWNTNLEWLTTKENVQYSIEYGGKRPEISAKNSVYPEEIVEKICQLMQSGITNYNEISMIVFGKLADIPIRGLISRIRQGKQWTHIISKYNKVKPAFHDNFSDDQVHKICQYLQTHPESMIPGVFNSNLLVLKNALGIDIDSLTTKQKNSMGTSIGEIKRRQKYTRISSQYNF